MWNLHSIHGIGGCDIVWFISYVELRQSAQTEHRRFRQLSVRTRLAEWPPRLRVSDIWREAPQPPADCIRHTNEPVTCSWVIISSAARDSSRQTCAYAHRQTDRRTEKTTDAAVEQNSHVLGLRAVTSRLAPADIHVGTVGSDLPMQWNHVIHVATTCMCVCVLK